MKPILVAPGLNDAINLNRREIEATHSLLPRTPNTPDLRRHLVLPET